VAEWEGEREGDGVCVCVGMMWYMKDGRNMIHDWFSAGDDVFVSDSNMLRWMECE